MSAREPGDRPGDLPVSGGEPAGRPMGAGEPEVGAVRAAPSDAAQAATTVDDPANSPVAHRAVVVAGFGQSMLLTFVTTFILLYLSRYAHFTAGAIGVATGIIGAVKIFDAFSDPVMGTIVDKTRTRWGKLRPYILFSAAPVAALTTAMFCIPDVSQTGKLVFFGIAYLLWGVAYTACDVPFWGLIGAVFTGDVRVRTISNVRAVQSIAMGLATLGGPWIALALSFGPQTTATGWSLAAAVIAFGGMGLFTRGFFGTREPHRPGREAPVTLRMLFATLLGNTPLLMVLLGSILGFGRTVIQAGGAVFAVVAWDDEGYFTLIGGAIIAGIVLAAFAAPRLVRRWSSKSVMVVSSLVGAAFNAIMYFVGFANIPVVMALIFVNGLTLGLFMVVQTTMIADAVDNVEQRTGIRNDGISFSTLTFVSKLMASAAVLVFGAALALSGYQEGVVVTRTMQDVVWTSITLVPALSCLVSTIPFALYRLPPVPEDVGTPLT